MTKPRWHVFQDDETTCFVGTTGHELKKAGYRTRWLDEDGHYEVLLADRDLYRALDLSNLTRGVESRNMRLAALNRCREDQVFRDGVEATFALGGKPAVTALLLASLPVDSQLPF